MLRRPIRQPITRMVTRAEFDELVGTVHTQGDALAGMAELVTEQGIRISALEGPGTPEPEPDPAPDPGPDEPVFMARPLRDPVVIRSATDVELSNFSIQGGAVDKPTGQGILLENVRRARITLVDFQNLIGGINIINCEDVEVADCRGRNIGISGQIGNGRGNFIQYNTSRGGAVRRNRFLGGQTEDMISTWRTGGWSADRPLIIEDNHLEGVLQDTATARRWTSRSGTGIIASDGAGHPNNGHITVRHNTLVNVGQVGLQHIDGSNLVTEDNLIIGERYALNNRPWASYGGNPSGVIRNNRYMFYSPAGAPMGGWLHQPGMQQSGNQWVDVDPDDYRVRL